MASTRIRCSTGGSSTVAGQLGKNEQPEGMRLLPVSVSDDEPSQSAAKQDPQTTSGVSINIEIPGRALVSVEGAVDSGQHADLAAGGDYRHARGLLGLHGCSVRRAAAYLKRSCRQK